MELSLLIAKNRAKLEKMISDGEDYQKILAQSRKLDKLINQDINRRFPELRWYLKNEYYINLKSGNVI